MRLAGNELPTEGLRHLLELSCRGLLRAGVRWQTDPAAHSPFPDETITVTDTWAAMNTLEVTALVVVFYDNGTEVGSIQATPYGDTESTSGAPAYMNALNPSPVCLTPDQSQTWTLPAGWTDNATTCTVETLTSSPPIPSGHLGQTG